MIKMLQTEIDMYLQSKFTGMSYSVDSELIEHSERITDLYYQSHSEHVTYPLLDIGLVDELESMRRIEMIMEERIHFDNKCKLSQVCSNLHNHSVLDVVHTHKESALQNFVSEHIIQRSYGSSIVTSNLVVSMGVSMLRHMLKR